MNIYHYDPETGEYAAQSEADASPLEPGVFLIPAFATEIAPPPAKAGCVAAFRSGAWEMVEDHRGKTYWLPDGNMHAIEELGPLPIGVLDVEPPPSTEQLDKTMRSLREARLLGTDWLVARHQDEQLLGVAPTLTDAQLKDLLLYRDTLRNLTDDPTWPNVHIPVVPAFAQVSHPLMPEFQDEIAGSNQT